MALGPILGGALLEAFWWGSVFLVNVPVALAAILATLLLAPPNDPNPAKAWDLPSSLFALLALVGAVLAVKELAHIPQNLPLIAAAMLVSVLGGWAFQRRQRRLAEPLLVLSIFRNRPFTAGVLAAAFAMFAIGGIQLVTTQRYQLVEGLSPLEAGLLVAAAAAGALPASILGGAVLHRTGFRPLIAGGLAVVVAGTVIAVVGAHQAPWLLLVGMVVVGIGTGAATSVASTAIISSAPADRAGMASSVEEVSYELGSLTAVAVLGSLITAVYSLTVSLPAGAPASARESLPEALAAADAVEGLAAAARSAYDTGYTVTMIAIAVITAAGAAITGWLLHRPAPTPHTVPEEDPAHATQ